MKGGEFLERQAITVFWRNLLHGDTLIRLLPLLPLRAGRSRPQRPWGPPSLLYNGYRIFPGGKAAGAWRWPPTPI